MPSPPLLLPPLQALEGEMAAPGALKHDTAGVVSLVVGEEKEREVTERLVAMGGKLVRSWLALMGLRPSNPKHRWRDLGT